MTLAAATRLGPYEIVSPLGAGGMGEVYRARDTRLRREVAVKVLPADFSRDPDRLRRFEQEARAASALNHPNILTVHDVGEKNGVPYVVSELLEGETLRERLASGPLGPRKAIEYGVQIAQGLAAAHEKGIVHRDLKPENVFVTADGRIKILDFGLAKLARPGAGAAATSIPTQTAGTEPGVVMGTVGYMAPEQVRGQAADARSDIFAFGAVLYEALTGTRAFRAESQIEILNAILKEEPPEPSRTRPEVPPALDRIVRRCLEKSPGERFQSARDLAFALSEAAGASSAPAMAPAVAPEHRGRLLGLGVGAATLVLAAILLVANVGGLRDRLRSGPAPGRIRSLAVLPLQNFSRDPEQEYFADGMTEELITDLAQIRSLRVISRTSAMAYKGTKKTLPEIGRELAVDGVLEGSVERAGDRVRITAQLIEAATDRHLWAKSYERHLKDVLALQSEVAQAVAGEVQAALTPQENARLARIRPVDPEIHEQYLRSRYALNRAGSRPDIEGAIRGFQALLTRAPDYAPAYAGLADAYVALTDFFLPPRETMPEAKAAAQRAIELDEGLAEAHASLGLVHFAYDWDWAGAERELRRAIELNPGLSAAHESYADYLMIVGRTEESRAEIRRAAELDPLSALVAYDGGWNATLARNNEEAVAWFRKAIELDPSNGWFSVSLALPLVQQGKLPEAVAAAEKGIASFDSPLARATAAGVFAAAGQKERARKMAEELRALSKTRWVCPYELGLIYLGLGDRDEAFRLLERGYQERSICQMYTKRDPRLDPVRSDPRYADLVRRLAYPS